jgi:hypothetical protein
MDEKHKWHERFDGLVEAAFDSMRCFKGDESMDDFEKAAAEARMIVHQAIMSARVWFMNQKERGDA